MIGRSIRRKQIAALLVLDGVAKILFGRIEINDVAYSFRGHGASFDTVYFNEQPLITN